MELTYTKHGNYLLPDLTLGEHLYLGKYAHLRLHYLQNHRRPLYLTMLTSGQLILHLQNIQQQAGEQVRRTVSRLAERQNVTEELKAKDQIVWVARINTIRQSAEESVLHDLIFV